MNVSATVLGDRSVSCAVPDTLPVQPQVQRVRALGREPVKEVQVITTTSAWGWKKNQKWELKAAAAAAVIPEEERAV
jgi:hypothetical protein